MVNCRPNGAVEVHVDEQSRRELTFGIWNFEAHLERACRFVYLRLDETDASRKRASRPRRPCDRSWIADLNSRDIALEDLRVDPDR